MRQPKAPGWAIDVAVRAYPRPDQRGRDERHDPGEPSGIVVVFDTETRIDVSQRLLFGSYQVYAPNGQLAEEGLIAADDLAESEIAILEEYRRGYK